MNAVPEPARRRLLTVADYHRMGESGILAPDERVELIDGEIFVMPPPIGPTHSGIVDHLTRLFVVALGERAIVRVQSLVRLSDLSEPEPDLALLKPRADFYKRRAPEPADVLLLIEVSDSTLAHDRRTKVPLYARHAIPEVWIADVEGARLIVYREPGADGYARERAERPPETLEPAMLPGTAIDLAGLFVAE